ncbi:MAG TPA: M14 family zinc carboxypeptidase [Polyangia bacterium]|nr:M14 family zinc carboxypeptidase [Polyangia bacterium]
MAEDQGRGSKQRASSATTVSPGVAVSRLVVVAVAVVGIACRGADDGAISQSGIASVAVAERSQPYRDYLSVTARPRDSADVRALWRYSEYVLAPHTPRLAPHALVILSSTLERLRALGIDVVVEPVDVQAMIDRGYEQGRADPLAHAPSAGKLNLFGPFFQQVQELDAIYQYLDQLAAASDGRATVTTIGKSVQNRDIRAIRVSTTPLGTARPAVIITGTQHAREWSSPMVVMGFVDALVRQYESDVRVQAVVDGLEIFVVPVVNPDGYVASHNGARLQRKNMNPVCNVDLNRNWGQWWGMGTPVDDCSQETYPGRGAFSEPETRAVRDLAQAHKNLRFYMDYHSPADEVMYPLCFSETKSPDDDEDKAWATAYSATFNSINGAELPAQSCFGIGGNEGGCSSDWFRSQLPNGLEVELRPGESLGGFGISNQLVLPFVEENWSAWIGVMTSVVHKYPPLSAGDAGAALDAGAVTDAGQGTSGDGSALDQNAGATPDVGEVETAPGSGCALAGLPSTGDDSGPPWARALASVGAFVWARRRRRFAPPAINSRAAPAA